MRVHFFFVCVSVDAEPPWIQCPGDIVAGTDERRGTANVRWNVPTATDNSNEEVGLLKTKLAPPQTFFLLSTHDQRRSAVLQVAVQVKPVYTPPQLFPIGKETIAYIATDPSGNQANCSFAVTVVGAFLLCVFL